MTQGIEDQNPRPGAGSSNSHQEGRRNDKEGKGIEHWKRWMNNLGRKNSKTLARHEKRLKGCRGKGIRSGIGNKRTSKSLLD
jgi:hypothetical protein